MTPIDADGSEGDSAQNANIGKKTIGRQLLADGRPRQRKSSSRTADDLPHVRGQPAADGHGHHLDRSAVRSSAAVLAYLKTQYATTTNHQLTANRCRRRRPRSA